MKMKSERTNFAGKVGLVLATAGSAVGLGNIWRFPVTAGHDGGGAFIIVYIFCVLLLGIPLMTAEFVVGRHAHANTSAAYRGLARGRLWRSVGTLGVFTGWFIMCYYVVVSGWILYYLALSVHDLFSPAVVGSATAYADLFNRFVSNPWEPLICVVLFVLMSHYVIVRGVERGIERFSKILMPMLFVIMVVLAVCSLFTEGAGRGLSFLFKPDFTKLTFRTVLDAMGQAFYSLSIAMGCLCTYASYFKKNVGLMSTAFKVGAIDTIVAVMAGIIIFPAVFSTGIRPDAGASLVFVALPAVFKEAFAAVPLLGGIVSVMFYFLLVLATLTSVISLHEVPTAYLSEECHMSRRRAATVVSVVCIAVGALCSLSMGAVPSLVLDGRPLFDWFDSISSLLLLPVGGFLIAVFVGWKLNRQVLWSELSGADGRTNRNAHWVVWLLRYFVPPFVLLIFLSGLGVW